MIDMHTVCLLLWLCCLFGAISAISKSNWAALIWIINTVLAYITIWNII
jgi:hypothetical protein